MVWAAISTRGYTLHFIQNDTHVVQRYLDVFLSDTATVEEQFLFMDHNARPYRVNIVNNWLDELRIEKFDWLANFH